VAGSGFGLRQTIRRTCALHPADVRARDAADVAAEHAQLRELARAPIERGDRGVEPSKRRLAGLAFARALGSVRGFVSNVGKPLRDAARVAAGKAAHRGVDREQHVLALACQRCALAWKLHEHAHLPAQKRT
jgi:hypothetical protein